MKHPSYSHLEKGTLLIASPEIKEGLLHRSVIILCEHGPNGSFGIVVNKPLAIDLPEIVDLQNSKNPNIAIRSGGMIQSNQLMLLHNSKEPKESLPICEGLYLGGDLNFLQRALLDLSGPSILLCFGYAGWAIGQLEREFLDNIWFLHPCQEKHLFETPPEKLWQLALQEKGGKYASLSTIPEDLNLN